MRLITKLLITGLLMLSLPLSANAALNEQQLAQELKQAESNKNTPNQAELVEALQSALNWINESKESNCSKFHASCSKNLTVRVPSVIR